MHLRAYMAALDIDDLDHMAKTAVQKIAGRANLKTAAAWVSIGRIAADMNVAYNTARAALDRAVEAGYLAVDKPAGKRPKWQLTSATVDDPTSSSDDRQLMRSSATVDEDLINSRGRKDVRRTSQGRAHARAARATGGRALHVENPHDALLAELGPQPSGEAGVEWAREFMRRKNGAHP